MTTKYQPATPLPWEVNEAFAHPRTWHVMPGSRQFCIASASKETNAAYIAHAANAYPRLVEEVQALRATMRLLLADRTRGDATARKADERNERSGVLLRELGEE